jgi:hypothetical protein
MKKAGVSPAFFVALNLLALRLEKSVAGGAGVAIRQALRGARPARILIIDSAFCLQDLVGIQLAKGLSGQLELLGLPLLHGLSPFRGCSEPPYT